MDDGETRLVPLAELLKERTRRRDAEKRVAELEAALKSKRDEWVFRRKRASN
jgi:hypothetical protein